MFFLQSNKHFLPNNKILDMTKLKAFANNKINVAQMMISVFDKVENIVEQEGQDSPGLLT